VHHIDKSCPYRTEEDRGTLSIYLLGGPSQISKKKGHAYASFPFNPESASFLALGSASPSGTFRFNPEYGRFNLASLPAMWRGKTLIDAMWVGQL